MTFKKLLYTAAALISLNANALDYTSTFTDNSNMVTEVRTFTSGVKAGTTERWEWLDLTVTNGISFNSIQADLNDDNSLNNSVALNSYSPIFIQDVIDNDVAGNGDGWSTVSDQGVVDLFNAFFGLSIVDEQTHSYGTNTTIVESFIEKFGDSYHEGLAQDDETYGNKRIDVDTNLANIGYTYGYTNSFVKASSLEGAYVFDGQFINNSTEDSRTDLIVTNHRMSPDTTLSAFGTFLVREAVEENIPEPFALLRQAIVTEVPEPSTLAICSLALMGFGARRLRNV